MFETSETTAALDAALAKAQGEIEAAAKDATNPAFKSKYADLTSVWQACRPALAKHGISLTQWPLHSEDSRLHIVTRVAHGGEWMRASFSVPVDKMNAQGYGSAMTYAKRYSLAAALGVVADDDDDGNAASARAQRQEEPAKASGAQVTMLTNLIRSHVFSDEERELMMGKVAEGLTLDRASSLIGRTQATLDQRKADEAERAAAISEVAKQDAAADATGTGELPLGDKPKPRTRNAVEQGA